MLTRYKEGGFYMSEDGFLDRQIDVEILYFTKIKPKENDITDEEIGAVVYNQEDNLKIMEMNTFASIFTHELEPWDCRDVCC